MKHTSTLLTLALSLLAPLSALNAADEPAKRPNIVVILTDDQGYGDMSALNPQSKFQTPHLDRIAREGLLFTDGHSAASICSPSRYALLTGRYSWRTTLKDGNTHLAEGDCLIAKERMTVASLLKEHGYHTAMFGKWHLNMKFPGSVGNRDWSQPITDGPTEHGFEEYFGIAASMNYGVLTFIENNRVTDPPTLWTHKKNEERGSGFRFMPPYDTQRQSKADIEIAPSFRDDICLKVCTGKAVDYIARHAEEAKAGKPFFVYLAMNSPHAPHCPAPEFVGKSQEGQYGDFMMETDYRVGQVLAALDEHGLARDTLVFQSSDNGPAAQLDKYQHDTSGGLKGRKKDIYEGGHRVPFVMRWPAVIKAGRTCDEPVGQVDLLATCADLLGVKLPATAGEDSYSLLPAIRGEDYPRPLRGPLMHLAGGMLAIREGQWKLNFFRGPRGSLNPERTELRAGEPPFELYDMKQDWRETTNAYDQHPEVVERLKATATRIVKEGRSTPGAAQRNDGAQLWPQLTFIPEAAALPSTRGKKNKRAVDTDE